MSKKRRATGESSIRYYSIDPITGEKIYDDDIRRVSTYGPSIGRQPDPCVDLREEYFNLMNTFTYQTELARIDYMLPRFKEAGGVKHGNIESTRAGLTFAFEQFLPSLKPDVEALCQALRTGNYEAGEEILKRFEKIHNEKNLRALENPHTVDYNDYYVGLICVNISLAFKHTPCIGIKEAIDQVKKGFEEAMIRYTYAEPSNRAGSSIQRAPKVRMVTLQSGYQIPKDWTDLWPNQQKLIEQMRASSPFPTNSEIAKLMNSGPSKKTPDLDKLNEIEEPVKPSRRSKTGASVTTKAPAGSVYSQLEQKQASAALKEALRMEKSGNLPKVEELLKERNEKMSKGEYSKMSKQEYSKAETEFNKKLHARMRLDLSRAPEQRQVFAADKKATSFVELLGDGTIHSYEQQALGKGANHKSEDWIYTDGTSVSWRGDIDQQTSSKNTAAVTHQFKEETIEIYQDPLKQDVFSSNMGRTQTVGSGAEASSTGANILGSGQIQEKLTILRQAHRHGPWG